MTELKIDWRAGRGRRVGAGVELPGVSGLGGVADGELSWLIVDRGEFT